MKTLKAILTVLAVVVGVVTFAACSDNVEADNQQSFNDQSQVETTADTTKSAVSKVRENQILDTIKTLSIKIEDVSQLQETNEKEVNKLNVDVSDLKGTSRLFDLISWAIAGIALVVAVIALVMLSSLRKRVDNHGLTIKELNHNRNYHGQPTTAYVNRQTYAQGISREEFNTLVARIDKIEKVIRQMDKSSAVNKQNANVNGSTIEAKVFVEDQGGYFGIPSQKSETEAYFKRLTSTRESDSLFRATVKGNQAKFEPIDGRKYLNEIKSNDTLKWALEIQGCAPSEATQMTLIKPGEAANRDNRWEITKKAQIKLSR